MKAGNIEPLRGIYKNAFNLILGAQGRGKTFHAEELVSENECSFNRVYRFAPESSVGKKNGGMNKLVSFLRERCREAERNQEDAKTVDDIRTSILAKNMKLALERGITKEKIEELLERYPSAKDVGTLQPVLVLIDDMGGDPQIKQNSAIFNDIARRLRHLQLTIIFNAHQYKDLAPFVRSNTQIAYVHGGLPLRDLVEICKERRIEGVRCVKDLERMYGDCVNNDNKFYEFLTLDFYGKMPKKINAQPDEPESSKHGVAVAEEHAHESA